MGIINNAFSWILGVQKRSIADLDVAEMSLKLRATARLRDSWEREIKAASKEYEKNVSVEENAKRSPIDRKLALQKGTIIAKRIKTLTSAVNMLNKMSGVVEQLKLLKKFYEDLSSTMALPRGMSVEDLVRQVYAMSDTMAEKKGEIDDLLSSIDSANAAISDATGDSEIEKLVSELNSLYDEYNTKLAMNDDEAAEQVREKIQLKQAEIDRQTGASVLV